MPDLRMIQMQLKKKDLVARARREGHREMDDGYLVHCWLTGALGVGALKPWATVYRNRDVIRLLGYTEWSLSQLREHAELYATPEEAGAVDWADVREKVMPSLAPGARVGVRVRVCPMVRLSTGERDVFSIEGEGGRPREEVYAAWLRDRLLRLGVAEVCDVAAEEIGHRRVLRRTQGEHRQDRMFSISDALMRATIVVGEDGAAALLRRGVGRHRAFGFGMALLTPPR